MIEYLSPDRIANAIVMDSSFNGASLIVEGRRDFLFFHKFISHKSCQIQIAFGKLFVIEVVKILSQRKFERGLGIIDRDFGFLLKQTFENDYLIECDYHDIEMSILDSPCFDTIVATHCSPEKMSSLFSKSSLHLKNKLLELITPLGNLKLANQLHDLGLVFKPQKPEGNALPYSDFIDTKTFTYLGHDKMVSSVFNFSVAKSSKIVSKDVIKTKLVEIESKYYDLMHLCNGHDFTFVFQLSLKKKIGQGDSSEISPKAVEQNLILGYDSSYFIQTTLYNKIKNWETKNKLKVLAF
ncbi:DUF4435 domain-containing protein [Pseudoflavitalea sp. X16]|uniref:DUF4435 domain-containing protein n=1 Tax=Paraflavitalea devenefica TaxID=2716334 RepID=UPI001421EAC7|nr:DUF4435 domain-containing protein [Paraflavitalea devenefica]NII26418.1 DUF4435 domain-containing protein [Paraflavitalea devenefica]